jgi:hypothetical protein
MEGSCEYGNELQCSIKFWEILEKSSDGWLLEKDLDPWNWLVSYVSVPISHAKL